MATYKIGAAPIWGADRSAAVDAICACFQHGHGHVRRCGATFSTRRRPDRPGTYGLFCHSCRAKRRRTGQLKRWADQRNIRPELQPRACGWSGCTSAPEGRPAQVPGYRRYCSREHAWAAWRGQPRVRRGAPVNCQCQAPGHAHAAHACGAPLGYRRPSRLQRGLRRYCADCRVERPWLPRPVVVPYCSGCGGPRGKRGELKLCRTCFLAQPRRRPYKHRRDKRVAALVAQGVSTREIAQQFKHPIPESTLYDILRRLRGPKPDPVSIVQTHPGVGMMDGAHYHQRMGEHACPACEAAGPKYLRERYRDRKLGVSGAGRHAPTPEIAATYKPAGRPRGEITHGTAAGYNAHRRRGEAQCDSCQTAWREDQTRRRRLQAPRPIGRPQIAVDSAILERIIRERDSGRSYREIATGLQADQVSLPGTAGRWYPATVRNIWLRADTSRGAALTG